MRKRIVTMMLLAVCSYTGTSFADEKSDCLNSCSNDKRASDMYCPPAGGYTDEENKQCLGKNSTEYNNCMKACSPPATPPAELESTATPPPSDQPEDPVSTDKRD